MNETQTLMSYHLFWRICFLWREQQLLQALSILHAKVSIVCILMGRAVAPKTTFNQYREQNGNLTYPMALYLDQTIAQRNGHVCFQLSSPLYSRLNRSDQLFGNSTFSNPP
jgi:hypothetical protein